MNKIEDVKETENISNEVFENIIRACFDENTENGIKYIKMYIEDPNIYHTWVLFKSYFKKELCYCSNSNNKCNCVTGKRYKVIDSITSLKYTESELYKFVLNNAFKANNYGNTDDDYICSNANYSNKQDSIKISKLIQNVTVLYIMSGGRYSTMCDEYKARWKKKLNIN